MLKRMSTDGTLPPQFIPLLTKIAPPSSQPLLPDKIKNPTIDDARSTNQEILDLLSPAEEPGALAASQSTPAVLPRTGRTQFSEIDIKVGQGGVLKVHEKDGLNTLGLIGIENASMQ
eukprot:6620258-Ditylum_brightwellii.AAC.1